MRFKGLDLNLLVVFDAVTTERNITRAAERLNLSQSATSNALARLRSFFGDELLVASGRQLVLTPRAEHLVTFVKPLLAQIDQKLIAEAEFDPTAAQRQVRIMCSDYASLVALHVGIAEIRRQAPGLRFQILPVNKDPISTLLRHDTDLLVTPESLASEDHPMADYFEDDFVCLIDEASRLAQDGMTLDAYMDADHVVVRFPSGADAKAYDEQELERLGHRKRVSIITYSQSMVPQYVVGGELIGTLQRRMSRLWAGSLPLKIVPLPFPIRRFKEVIQWHILNAEEPLLRWIVDQLISTQRRMDA